MNKQEINSLKILEEVGNDEVPSQREIAKNLNISLGLVNSFIKRLVRKGYLKTKSIQSNRVKYLLTPRGVAEKTRLTYAYIQYSYHFYKDARLKLQRLFSELSEQNVKRIVFYGATDLAEIAYLSLQETPIQLVGIFDADKTGSSFLGLKIEHPVRLSEFSYDRLLYTDD
ncbi:MAG: winged helix-turn-helix transcriptional regulator, partial [Proteobacteria bacterium]|nr:winged helix-turn-helix transcriptional regulator [Pseudomonadota bacterium]